MPDLRHFRPKERLTLERVLTDPEYFGLTTASPLQRALCRILDGIPLGDLAEHPDVVEAVGGAVDLPLSRPKEFLLLAGIRSGKSLIAAAAATRAALTCDVSTLGPGEIPRVPIVSLSKDTARATWDHVKGRIESSPRLRTLLVSEPTQERLALRHPTGREVEICITAGSRAAGSLVARWLATVIFDEAPRMVGEEDGVVNLDHARHAIGGRVLPGGQVLLIGSAWAPFGPVYDLIAEHFGKPSEAIVCARARGPAMNPAWWTPERCAELKARNPDAYRVDVENEFLDPESTLLAATELAACRREWPLIIEPEPRRHYVAAMDPATRGNAWTLVVAKNDAKSGEPTRLVVVCAKQWIGSASEPLSPRKVLEEIATTLRGYRLTTAHTDEWAADSNNDLAQEFGLWLVSSSTTGAGTLEQFNTVRNHIIERTLELPPDPVLIRDLGSVRKRVTQTSASIVLPQTSDGRHCDYAPALAKVVAHPPLPAEPDPLPAVGTQERMDIEAAAAKEAARREVLKRAKKRGWSGVGRVG